MKKLVLTLVLGVFAFGANAQSDVNDGSGEFYLDDCAEEAWQAGNAAFEQYGGHRNMFAAVFAYIATEEYFSENCE